MLKFYVAHPKRPTSVIYFRASGHKVYTNITISTDNWDKKRQRLKKNAFKINENLDLIDSKVTGKVAEVKMSGKKVTKKQLLGCIGKEERSVYTFVDWCEAFTESEKKGLKSELTIKGYTTFVNHLKAYEKSRKRVLNFSDINVDFYKDFERYFVKETGNHPNTFGRAISKIKVFMGEAVRKGLTTSQGFKDKEFKRVEIDTQKVYLSEAELLKLWNKDFSDNPRLEKARDMLIAGCWTGLRISDYKTKIRKEYIQGDSIRLEGKKTGEFVVIPLHWMLQKLLEKYGYEISWKISDQQFNQAIKDACEKAGIDYYVTVREYKKGVPVDVTYKKHQLVTSHIGRRSLATNLYLANVPKRVIMTITGHKSEADFDNYVQIEQEVAAKMLRESDVFKR